MPELSWQYTALGLLLVVMNRAKDAVATVRKDCSKDRYEAWHSLFVERFMQVSICCSHSNMKTMYIIV